MADDKEQIAQRRDLMRGKYLEHGADIFEIHELLEILLYYPMPGKDTNLIAHNLLDRFGSISGVLDAPFDILVESGLTEHTAFLLNFLPEFFGVYRNDKLKTKDKILKPDIIPEILVNVYLGKKVEMAYVILMNAKWKELYSGIVSRGTTVNTDLNVPKICERAIHYSAKYVIVAHNHPTGDAFPSNSDILATINLYKALNSLQIKLVDHFIVSKNNCLSFFDTDILFKSEEEYFQSDFYRSFFG